MKKVKKIAVVLVVGILLFLAFGVFYLRQNWPVRFGGELDKFFGKGNWECISGEKKESLVYEKHVRVRRKTAFVQRETVPGKFHDWDIQFQDAGDNNLICSITDHTYRINKEKYHFLSAKRLSAKQALTLELMDISFGLIGDEIMKNTIEKNLSEAEADCIQVEMSYSGGNPKPEFYDRLSEQSWFNINDVSAEKYLAEDSHDFYIDIRAFDYKLEKLTDAERSHLLNSLHTIEKALLDEFGEDASFKIYFDDTHETEYEKGQKVHKD